MDNSKAQMVTLKAEDGHSFSAYRAAPVEKEWPSSALSVTI